MLNPLLAASAMLMLFSAPSGGDASRPLDWESVIAGVQQVVVHVPRITVTSTTIVTRRSIAPPPPMVEYKADKCVKLKKITGFSVNRGDSVELMLEDGKRLRARLGSNCPALGFYSGFYIRPNKDGKICAGRDMIRSRSGGSCSIDRFMSLKPAK